MPIKVNDSEIIPTVFVSSVIGVSLYIFAIKIHNMFSQPHVEAAGVRPPILLFLRFSFGIPPDFGDFSVLPSFLLSVFAFVPRPFIEPRPPGACFSGGGSTGLRPVEVRWNSPGLPVMGFSSKYSPP